MAFSLSPPVDPLTDDTQWGVGWKPRSHLSYFPIKCHWPARPLQICSALHFIAPTQHMWSRLWKWTGCLATVIIADAHVSKNLIGLSKKVGTAVEKLKLKQVSNGKCCEGSPVKYSSGLLLLFQSFQLEFQVKFDHFVRSTSLIKWDSMDLS